MVSFSDKFHIFISSIENIFFIFFASHLSLWIFFIISFIACFFGVYYGYKNIENFETSSIQELNNIYSRTSVCLTAPCGTQSKNHADEMKLEIDRETINQIGIFVDQKIEKFTHKRRGRL